jgi:hypothetical protein
MPELLPPYCANYGPELDLSFAPEQLERFERDHEEGPIIGFVRGESEDVQLVVVEHDVATLPFPPFWNVEKNVPGILHNGNGEVFARLVFTPTEWVAFYYGVQTGEFDHVYGGTGDVYTRDSKNPDDYMLCFTREGYCSLLDAIKTRKYDFPERQHTEICFKLELVAAHTGPIALAKGVRGVGYTS